MHEVTLLINIAVALVVAFFGGLAARRIGLPTIIGYMLAGIVIGPFTPGFVGDTETISQLAELGVIFLMFGVGLHFSIHDLWKVRAIAIPGALGRLAITTLMVFGLSRVWGWTPASGFVIGIAISIASTVVLLRGLIDSGLLNTQHGQAAVGWVIVEDLATVLILVLLPTLSNTSNGFDWGALGSTLLKAAGFVVLVLFAGTRLIPWVLLRIAHTRSRELFILAILTITLGTAIGAAELFGVSLALGAFVAGVVVSESPLSHQVGADVLPFREAFAVLFFVSIGMLVNPSYLLNNIGIILALTFLIVISKSVVTALLGFVFAWPARTTLVLAAGLSQIGEFSFILGQEGMGLGLLDRDQYSLILAGALLSITLNTPMFRLITPIEEWLQRFPTLWRFLNRRGLPPTQPEETISGHVVIVGYGRVGRHIANLLEEMSIPHLVVDSDPGNIEELTQRNVPALFGDAANSEVLKHVGLRRARVLVVAGPDEDAGELVVTAARDLAPDVPIIARSVTEEGTRRLAQRGAQYVIHPELEGGLEIVRHTLLLLGFPLNEIYRYTDAVRHDHYDLRIDTEEEHRLLHNLLDATKSIEIKWFGLQHGNPLVGQPLLDANLRARTGASVVAIIRGNHLIPNPKSMTIFEPEDRIGLIGDQEEIEAAEKLISASGIQVSSSGTENDEIAQENESDNH
jgi:monovalent cation:H+ antiporter-2, CPA2 family